MYSRLIVLILLSLISACSHNPNKGFNDSLVDWSQVEVRTRAQNCNASLMLGDTEFSFFYDKTKWALIKSDDISINFENRYGAASAIIIYEKMQVPIDRIPQYVTSQLDKEFRGSKLSNVTKKVVNGVIVSSYIITCPIDYVNMKLICYSYSSMKGTVQLRAISSDNIFDEMRPELEEFLDGFVGVKS